MNSEQKYIFFLVLGRNYAQPKAPKVNSLLVIHYDSHDPHNTNDLRPRNFFKCFVEQLTIF